MPKPRNQSENRDYRKKSLLKATIATIASFGVEGATIAKICAEAGASRGMSAHYFKSKEDLLTASFAHIFENTTAIKQSIVDSCELSAIERIYRCAAESFQPPNFGWENIAAWQAFTSASTYTPRYRKVIKTYNKSLFNTYFSLFIKANSEHCMNVSEKQATLGLLALLDGLWTNIALKKNNITAKSAITACNCYIDGCFHSIGTN
jgi:AcrR family transcriptional regulator